MNNKNVLGTFDAKYDEGILFRYSYISKAYKVFNKIYLVVEEFINVIFDESPQIKKFNFDVDYFKLEKLNLNNDSTP